MNITKKQIKEKFSDCEHIDQIGSAQFFIIYFKSYRLMVSYEAIVGVSKGITNYDLFYITDKKYSVSTTRQVNKFIASNNTEIIKQEVMIEMVYGIEG